MQGHDPEISAPLVLGSPRQPELMHVQGDKEFNVEVSILAKLKHPNLVSLLGVCVEGDHRLAVFDLCPGGSLRGALDAGRRDRGLLAASQPQAQHVKRPAFGRKTVLQWSERLQVAHGAACGLAFLHEVGVLSCFWHTELLG